MQSFGGACEVEFFGAQCRQDEPDVEICLSETPLSQQIKGLNSDLYDAGFARPMKWVKAFSLRPSGAQTGRRKTKQQP